MTQDELHDSQSRQSEAFREEREGLVERVRFLEEQLEASQASAAAAAEQMPVGDAYPWSPYTDAIRAVRRPKDRAG